MCGIAFTRTLVFHVCDSVDITRIIAYTVLYFVYVFYLVFKLHNLITVVHYYISGVVFHPLLKATLKVT